VAEPGEQEKDKNRPEKGKRLPETGSHIVSIGTAESADQFSAVPDICCHSLSLFSLAADHVKNQVLGEYFGIDNILLG
jgi:hypothetical protein